MDAGCPLRRQVKVSSTTLVRGLLCFGERRGVAHEDSENRDRCAPGMLRGCVS